MYETIEIFDDNNSLDLRDILKSCIYNYYNNNKNSDNKLHNMKGE